MDTIERRAGDAWILGTGLWIIAAAIEVVQVPEGAGFVAFELLWAVAQLVLLVGLVGLARSRPWGGRRAGTVGLAIASWAGSCSWPPSSTASASTPTTRTCSRWGCC